MRLKVDQLAGALQKNLAPVYWVGGDEPLQVGEAADEVRAAARRAGYTTREVVSVETGNEWPLLMAEAESLSIFSDKKLIDLRLPSAKPGIEGGKVLVEYCKKRPDDTILLISAGKLEAASSKSQWFQALENIGVVVQVWPLQGQEFLQWLQRRTERRGMHLSSEAVRLLASRVEGNLLAAAQEIEKLFILHGAVTIDKAAIEGDVADSSRFDVFKLVEALSAGKLNRAVRILQALRAEGVAAPVVLWAISREARLLWHLHSEAKVGGLSEATFKKYQVWDKRKQAVQEAMVRIKPAELRAILLACAATDARVKGQVTGDEWEGLFEICRLWVKPLRTGTAA